jgi:hypothetical protein
VQSDDGDLVRDDVVQLVGDEVSFVFELLGDLSLAHFELQCQRLSPLELSPNRQPDQRLTRLRNAMTKAPSGWNPAGSSKNGSEPCRQCHEYTAVSIALQVNATSPRTAAPQQAVRNPVTGDAAATDEN